MRNNMSKNLFFSMLLNFIICWNAPLYASDIPPLIFPVACTYGQDCWAVNYLDVDPALQKAKDFKCSQKTYDNHHGTDIALGSIAQMNKGVNVIAAANGKVLRVRDGKNDQTKTYEDLENIRKNTKECGNGIIIDHGGGLQTMYCHLKQGSIIVKPDEKVTAGQVIAQIGQSGLAEFPHLHFGITHKGKIIDPFTGYSNQDGCGKMAAPLWAAGQNIAFDPTVIFNGGFLGHSPNFKDIEKGTQTSQSFITLSSEILVLWVGFYNIEHADKITLKIFAPDKTLYASHVEVARKSRTRQYYFLGKKTTAAPLQQGQYMGEITLERKSKKIKTEQFSVQIE